MRNAVFTVFSFLLLLLAGSCNQTGKPATSDVDSTAVEAVEVSDAKHTKEYITQRLNDIYKMQDDSKGCSERYMKLYKEASELSHLSGMTFLDRDHWMQGNDRDEDWSYSILDVTDIQPTTATATVLVSNYNEYEVTLKLVFEHGDWYVDNFLNNMEGGYGGPDVEPEIYDEAKEIQTFITEVKKDVEISRKLVGDWGWVGDDGPELLLGFSFDEDGLHADECTIYRITSFEKPLCGVYDGKLHIGQRPDNDAIDVNLELNEKGDELTGHIMLKLPRHDYSYDGPITLRKNYFKFGK